MMIFNFLNSFRKIFVSDLKKICNIHIRGVLLRDFHQEFCIVLLSVIFTNMAEKVCEKRV